MSDRPFFERVQIWEPEEGIRNGSVYFEVTNSGTVLVFGVGIHEGRYKSGGIDHGFPWLHLRARSSDRGRTWTVDERNWWEPETRIKRASVVDRTTGEIFLFNQGTWPLRDDKGLHGLRELDDRQPRQGTADGR